MSSSPEQSQAARDERSGLIAGIAAFATWGLIPVYWKLLANIPASEILAHRLVWTTLFLVLLLSWQGRWPELGQATRSRRALLYCFASGIAISVNWLAFIWAVNVGRVIETSLGYFMTPLVNVLFGAIFLRERLTRWQFISVMLALVGVLNLTFGYGRFPWLAVTLCVSFGLYGLLRKKSAVRPIPGLFLETTLLTPIAAAYLVYLQWRGVRFRTLVAVPGLDQHRCCHWSAPGLVRPRCAASSDDHRRFPPIPLAELQLFPGRLSVSRAFHPRAPHYLCLHLGRARDLYRGSYLALAFRTRT